ncbi:MAG: AraC family transcriptional regulator [Bacteroidota bacterium]
MIDADIHTLYKSDFYRILDFKCRCTECCTSKPEYSESFSISFIRKGNFIFNTFRNSHDSYSGRVLLTKPGYERTVRHAHAVPDECTIFDFTDSFYKEIIDSYPSIKFLLNNDAHSSLIKSPPEVEVLHQTVLSDIFKKRLNRLRMDSLVLEIIGNVFSEVDNDTQNFYVSANLKKHHLITVEDAKGFMLQNYQDNISLLQLARHCNVSPFHFSRIFKKITSYSPHQFLTAVRLKNSELLIRETQGSIIDVALQSGFNSIEHFTTSFSNKFGISPAAYRNSI